MNQASEWDWTRSILLPTPSEVPLLKAEQCHSFVPALLCLQQVQDTPKPTQHQEHPNSECSRSPRAPQHTERLQGDVEELGWAHRQGHWGTGSCKQQGHLCKHSQKSVLEQCRTHWKPGDSPAPLSSRHHPGWGITWASFSERKCPVLAVTQNFRSFSQQHRCSSS